MAFSVIPVLPRSVAVPFHSIPFHSSDPGMTSPSFITSHFVFLLDTCLLPDSRPHPPIPLRFSRPVIPYRIVRKFSTFGCVKAVLAGDPLPAENRDYKLSWLKADQEATKSEYAFKLGLNYYNNT